MIIQLVGEAAKKYRHYLEQFRVVTGKDPGPSERTEAFFCARSKDPWSRPHWI